MSSLPVCVCVCVCVVVVVGGGGWGAALGEVISGLSVKKQVGLTQDTGESVLV